jgi:hypothetical protein
MRRTTMPGLVKRISHARYKTGTASVIEDMVTVMAHSETTCPRANPIIIAVCKYLVWGVGLGFPIKGRSYSLGGSLDFCSCRIAEYQ